MIDVMKPLEKMFFLAVLFVIGMALALHFTGKSLTDVAMGAKPPSPPGQGECAHGNSNKPCKDDPQPEHGKDCEEHGPKNGGVNEDHCKGQDTTPTETTPTETTPTETTPTTPEPPSTTPTPPACSDCPQPTVPETTTPTESKPPKVVKPVVTPTQLQNDLDQQAQQNGATNAPGHVQAADELPYTGVSLLWAVVLGLALIALGGYLRGYRIVRTFKA